MRRLFLLLLFLVLVAGAAAAWLLLAPYGPSKQVFVDIPPGTSTTGIARLLARAGVIRNEWSFLAARALQSSATLQAGEYAFDHPQPVLEVFRKIARGEVFYYELTIPEGSNIFDIGSALQELGVMKAEEFLKVARHSDLIRDLSPKAPSLEGYLFPATYRVTRHTTAKQVAQEMTARFRRAWRELDTKGQDVHEIVTLASLVEKETAAPKERPVIASVYWNRLRVGMKLDCDPTTIYAALLENRYRGTIHRSDLASTNPYNTYTNSGLPPGPIANPGTESLKAALDPAPSDYLFFVAKPGGVGEHNFSASLAEHSAAVQAFRRGQAQR